MKVLILKDGETVDVNDSYGARLIEQGKAVVIPAKAEKKAEKAEKAPEAETPAEEAPAAKPTKRKK